MKFSCHWSHGGAFNKGFPDGKMMTERENTQFRSRGAHLEFSCASILPVEFHA